MTAFKELENFFSSYEASRLRKSLIGEKLNKMNAARQKAWLAEKQRPCLLFIEGLNRIDVSKTANEEMLFALYKFVCDANVSLTLIATGTERWRETLTHRIGKRIEFELEI